LSRSSERGLRASELSYDELVEWQVESLIPVGWAIGMAPHCRRQILRSLIAGSSSTLLGTPAHYDLQSASLSNAADRSRERLASIIRKWGRACVCAPDTPIVSVPEAQ